MKCPKCDVPVGEGASFCHRCGSALELTCDGCGRRSPHDASFCAGCGARLASAAPTAPLAEGPIPAAPDAQLNAQRRPVTVLMADLAGYTTMGERLDPEEVAAIMGQIKLDGTRIIESFGGIVNQFVGDEILALFGLPTSSEEDPRRAVSAALALHARVAELNETFELGAQMPLAMHSGIHTGLLIAEIKDRRSGLYEVFGDTVNTAARLRSLAGSGEIMIGHQTHEAVAPYFEIDAGSRHMVRGKEEALLAYRVISARANIGNFDVARARGLTPFSGRGPEIARLNAALESARLERGHTLIVEGEAGSGKSRLCYEFVGQAAMGSDKTVILKGRCQSYAAAMPYSPFIQIVSAVLGVSPEDGPDLIAAAIEAKSGRIPAQYGAAYHSLLSSGSNQILPSEWRGDALTEALQESIVQLVLSAPGDGVAIVQLDDWHWADEASRKTLGRLSQKLPGTRALLLITTRPGVDPIPENPELVERIPLGPLSRDATVQIVLDCTGASSVQVELANAIYERTLGNPFFTEELCTALKNSDSTRIVQGEFLYTGSDLQVAIPETVQAVVRGRIDALPAQLQDVLKVASVFGRHFESDALAHLLNRVNVEPLLQILADMRFVERMAGDPSTFRFRHIITQEVAYDAILLRERKLLHARIAAYIEASQSDQARDLWLNVETLARHFHHAGQPENALKYFELSADKAVARSAWVEARQQLQAAIRETEALDQDRATRARRARLIIRWAEACVFLPSETQIALLERVVTESIEDGNFPAAMRASYWINWIYYSVGNQRAAESGTRLLVERMERSGEGHRAAALRCHLGQVLCMQRRLEEGMSMLEQGLKQRTRLDEHGEIDMSRVDGTYCFSHSLLSIAHADRGEFVRSRNSMAHALALVRRAGERATEASILTCASIAACLEADWAAMYGHIAEINVIPEPSVSPYVKVLCDILGGYSAYRLGHGESALRRLRRGVEQHEQSEAQLVLCMSLGLLADATAREGHLDEAVGLARRALARQGVGDRFGEDLAMRLLLANCGMSGPGLAREVARALELAGTARSDRELGLCRLAAARAHHRAGEHDAAAEQVRVALAILDRLSTPSFRADVKLAAEGLEG